jgi:hypothetical protein
LRQFLFEKGFRHSSFTKRSPKTLRWGAGC